MGLASIFLGLAALVPASLCLLSGGTDGTASQGPWAPALRGIAAHGAIVSAMSVALIVLGTGQLRGRAWADRGLRAWSIAALAGVAAMIALSLGMTGPALRAVMGDPPVMTMWDAPLFELMLFPHQLPPAWCAIILAACYAPFPLVVLGRYPPRKRSAQ